MRPRFRQRPTGVQYHDTYVEIDGVDHAVCVGYYIQREEADTGTPAGIDLDSIIYSRDSRHGKDAWDDVSEAQKDEMAITIGEYGDDADYADYLYDQMKDEQMERE